jgi:phosphoglycerate dehydrogenase-like enzyme
MYAERTPLNAAIDRESELEAATFGAAIWMRPSGLAEQIFGSGLFVLREFVPRQPAVILTDLASDAARAALARTEVLITGWGIPQLSTADLAAAPSLRAVLHAGGQASSVLPAAAWDSGLLIGNAGAANAVPVAEYSVAMILLAGAAAFEARDIYRLRRSAIDREAEFSEAGNYGCVVGIVGASRIGRLVIQMLRSHDVEVIVYDPYVAPMEIRNLGARPADLHALMAESDVVSVHAPLNRETRGLIGRECLAAMKAGATIVNTSRGAVIDQAALIVELESGRIRAILDVTDPEVLEPGNPLYDLPNVFLTPHMAGSKGRELRRIGLHVARELARLSLGQPLRFPEPSPALPS